MAFEKLPNEKDLLMRVLEGDRIAFARLFDAYHSHLGSYVFKMTESIEDTEEIVQDVFVKIWLNRSALNNINSFSDYLFIMCRNKTLNHLRKTALQKTRWTILEQELNYATADSDDEVIESMRALIEEAIDKLPTPQRETLLLSKTHRLKYTEIAERQGITSEAVKKRLSTARQFIKTYVHDHMDDVILLLLFLPIPFR